MELPVEVISVNFKTKEFTEKCLTSFRGFYPEVRMIIIDNGSNDSSSEYLSSIKSEHTLIITNSENIGHGPALHQGFKISNSPYIFTLDSDCIVKHGGFLEIMLEEFKIEPNLYAIGWMRWVDIYSGVPVNPPKGYKIEISPDEIIPPTRISKWKNRDGKHKIIGGGILSYSSGGKNFTEYIHPSSAMWDRGKYFTLPTFSHEGAPCRPNMCAIGGTNFLLKDFKIEDYINHNIAGTRRFYGGRWNPQTKEIPNPAWKDIRHPI